jgi:predicted  nucleic acid-binding Zn-ribbon protein
MGDGEGARRAPQLEVLHTVRCLSCGAVYSKPARGGTVTANPGCPDCGYVGWLTTSSATALALRHRFAADRRRRHSA